MQDVFVYSLQEGATNRASQVCQQAWKRSQCELEASMERNDLPFQSRRRLCTLAYCSMPARCQKHRALQPKDSYWLGCKARVTRVQPQVVQPAGTLSLALSPLRLQHCDHHDSQPFPHYKQTAHISFWLLRMMDAATQPLWAVNSSLRERQRFWVASC